MSSAHVDDLLTEYIDGNLKGPKYDRVKSHLVFCTSCRQLHQDILTNITRLKSIPQIQPSKELEKRIIKAITDGATATPVGTSEPRPSWMQWLVSFRGMSLAGAAVLLIFVIQNAPKMFEETVPEKGSVVGKRKSETKPLPPSPASSSMDSKELKMAGETENFAPAAPPAVAEAMAKTASQNSPVDSIEMMPMAVPKAESEKSNQYRVGGAGLNARQSLAPTSSISNDNQIISGFFSGITQPLEKVISDQKTWEDYWAKHQRGANQSTPLPLVDFEKYEVMAVFAGTQPTAGFRVEITRVLLTEWENAPARVVRYKISGPPEGTMAATVLTHPFCIKIVPKAPGPTFFKRIR